MTGNTRDNIGKNVDDAHLMAVFTVSGKSTEILKVVHSFPNQEGLLETALANCNC
jgi:hypothetical protein